MLPLGRPTGSTRWHRAIWRYRSVALFVRRNHGERDACRRGRAVSTAAAPSPSLRGGTRSRAGSSIKLGAHVTTGSARSASTRRGVSWEHHPSREFQRGIRLRRPKPVLLHEQVQVSKLTEPNFRGPSVGLRVLPHFTAKTSTSSSPLSAFRRARPKRMAAPVSMTKEALLRKCIPHKQEALLRKCIPQNLSQNCNAMAAWRKHFMETFIVES